MHNDQENRIEQATTDPEALSNALHTLRKALDSLEAGWKDRNQPVDIQANELQEARATLDQVDRLVKQMSEPTPDSPEHESHRLATFPEYNPNPVIE